MGESERERGGRGGGESGSVLRDTERRQERVRGDIVKEWKDV